MAPTPEPDLQIAARLLAEGRSGDAVERLGALVAGAPVYAAAHVLLATALEADDRPDEALAAWGRAAALVPSSPLVHRERRRLLGAARAAEPDAAPPAPDSVEVEEPADDVASDLEDDVLADVVADARAAAGTDEPRADETESSAGVDADVLTGGAAYDLRPVDERFLRDDPAGDLERGPDEVPDDEALDEDVLDDEVAGHGDPDAEAVAPDALFDPSDIFDGIAAAPGGRSAHAEPAAPPPAEAAPEGSATADHPGPDHPAHVPGRAGWPEPGAEASPEAVPPPGAAPPRPDALADELDALISRLGEAPPIRPDPAFSGPAVSFDDSGADEMASETLAKIYAAQRQFGRAADVYETLAAREPERADDLLRQADEMRQRR